MVKEDEGGGGGATHCGGDDASEWLSVSTATCGEFSRLIMEGRKVLFFYFLSPRRSWITYTERFHSAIQQYTD